MQQGISSFVNSKPDYELDPIGIASFQDHAEKLANMGRNGDTYIVHAAEGETVLPMEVLDANPQLKNMLFTQMRDMGIEPERYIVGSDLNSINPITGQPEFFFKKIFKGLKNVGKALKKNASVVLPIALNYLVPGMGSTFAGTVGAGIGSLIEGDDPREAFRSAALGGLSGAALAGLTGGRSGITSDFSKSGTFLKGLTGTGDFAEGTFRNPFTEAQQFFASGTTDPKNNVLSNAKSINDTNVMTNEQALKIANAEMDTSYFKSPFAKPPTIDEIIDSNSFKQTVAGVESLSEGKLTPDAVLKLAQDQQKTLAPSFLQKYGVPLAGITGAAALGGFFSAPEEEPEEEILTGQDLIDEDPDKYYIDVAAQPFVDQTQVASAYGIPSLSEMSPYPIPTFNANKGGAAYPRRTGGIGPGLGSGTKDDVPAMLTDGEFVMTRKAVKNAGNGSLNKGIKNMYSLMRNLETRRA